MQNVLNHRSHVERSTTFYKDLSSVYLKDVNNQRFNQSYHDTRSWYHGTVASYTDVLWVGHTAFSPFVERKIGAGPKEQVHRRPNGMAASIERLQAPSLHLGSPGACWLAMLALNLTSA